MPDKRPLTKFVAVDRDGNFINLHEGGSRLLEVNAEQDLNAPIEQWAVFERYELKRPTQRAGDFEFVPQL